MNQSNSNAKSLVPERSVDELSKTRRTHAERREEAEQRMLEAAVRIVAEQGLEGLTLAECGEAAGYSRGLAAHYFGTKHELIIAIATHIVGVYARAVVTGTGGKRGLEGLLVAVSFYIDSGREHPIYLRAFNAVLSSALSYPVLTQAVADINRQAIDIFAGGIRACIEKGEVRPDMDPRAQAVLLLATLRGVLNQWLIAPDAVDLDAIKTELLKSLRDHLAPRPNQSPE